uniref:Vacuolar protein sorting-associated protein 16 homolog n=1 Tax=Pelodiscus sinensis TaxID=13735 RepID=K7FQH3_PELSI
RKFELYSMAWNLQEDLRAPYLSPAALLKNNLRREKSPSSRPLLEIYSASGLPLASMPGNRPGLGLSSSGGGEEGRGWPWGGGVQEETGCLVAGGGGGGGEGTEVLQNRVREAKVFHTEYGTGVAILTGAHRFSLTTNIDDLKLRRMPEVPGLQKLPSCWAVLSQDRVTLILLAVGQDLYLLDSTSCSVVTPPGMSPHAGAYVQMAVSFNYRYLALLTDTGSIWMGTASLKACLCLSGARPPPSLSSESPRIPACLCLSGARPPPSLSSESPRVPACLCLSGARPPPSLSSESPRIPACLCLSGARPPPSLSSESPRVPACLCLSGARPPPSLSSESPRIPACLCLSGARPPPSLSSESPRVPACLCLSGARPPPSLSSESPRIPACLCLSGARPPPSLSSESPRVPACLCLSGARPPPSLSSESPRIPACLCLSGARPPPSPTCQLHLPCAQGAGSVPGQRACSFHTAQGAGSVPGQRACSFAPGLTPGALAPRKRARRRTSTCAHRLLPAWRSSSVQAPGLTPGALAPRKRARRRTSTCGRSRTRSCYRRPVYTVVLHLKNELNRGTFFMTLQKQPVALSLYRQFCKHQELETLKDLSNQDDDHQELGNFHVHASYSKEQSREHRSAACESRRRGVLASAPQATEDQIKLLRMQRRLQDELDKPYVDFSLHDTVYSLILDGSHKRAEQLYRDFRIPDKRFWWLKISALAERDDWEELEKFSKSKKSPIGYLPGCPIALSMRPGPSAPLSAARAGGGRAHNSPRFPGRELDQAADAAIEHKNETELNLVLAKCTAATDSAVTEKIHRAKAQLLKK